MIRINVIARIADDKNFFLDIVYLLHTLKEDNITDVQVLFIGAIQNYSIYQNILNMAELLSVTSQVSFTKSSIRINELPADVKDGYFLHFCVGDFIGYSGAESIQSGIKNIFYNIDRRVTIEHTGYVNMCGDITGLISFVKNVHENRADVDEEIKKDSLKILAGFKLNPDEKNLLLDMLKPNNKPVLQ